MLVADLHGAQRVSADVKAELGFDDLTAAFAECILSGSIDWPVFVAYRARCRAEGDYKTADWIRDELARQGGKLEDTPTKTRIKTI